MQAPFEVHTFLEKRDGSTFTNGLYRAMVMRIDYDDEKCWLDTGNYIAFKDAGLYRAVAPAPDINPQTFKADAGKPRWSLLMTGCASALAGVVRVLTFAVRATAEGGKGYLPHSWKEVPNATERYKDALHRHLNKIEQGETHDDESGELHWHHVATNALFLAELNKDSK